MKNKNNNRIREQVDRLGRASIPMLDFEIERLERVESMKRLGRSLLTSLITVSAVIILITNLWVTVLQVDGSSMNPLLEMDEVVITIECDKPIRNDIIAFHQNNKLYIKRVIAVAGDRVAINSEGIVSVNGNTLNEPYVAQLSLGNSDIEFPYMVPAGTVFVLGDNRVISSDSRDSRFGTISMDQIIGEVAFTVWPPSHIAKVI